MTQTTLEPGVIIQGRYELRRLLGQGGMGSVWVAWHQGLQIEIAVKFVETTGAKPAEMVARFAREASAVARIKSPHVVTIMDHGFDEEHQRPFIAMELLTGESLGDRLRREQRLPVRDTVEIVRQALRGLAKAHEAGVIHRDLKPDNLFLCQDDELTVKILDFGIAKTDFQFELTGHSGPQTRTGAIVGTPNYMSPEQTMGNKSVDHRSDLYAMGVVAFHCLAGTLPFHSTGLGELLVLINTQPIPSLRAHRADVPESIEQWVTQSLAKKADARFQSAKEMSAALGAACDQGEISAHFSPSDAGTRPASQPSGEGSLLVILPGGSSAAPRTSPEEAALAATMPGRLSIPPARAMDPTAPDDRPAGPGSTLVLPETSSPRPDAPVTLAPLSAGETLPTRRSPSVTDAPEESPRELTPSPAGPRELTPSPAGSLVVGGSTLADGSLSVPPPRQPGEARTAPVASRRRALAAGAFVVLLSAGGVGLWAHSARPGWWPGHPPQVASIATETPSAPPVSSAGAAPSGSGRGMDSPYQQACDKGDAHSCASLGLLYETGRGVVPDRSAAAALFQKACDGGDAVGCANLAMACEIGRGVPKDEARAAQLYQQACDGGDTRSCHNLGTLYENGKGVGKDSARAAQLYQKGCDGAYLASCGALGLLSERGEGVPQDKPLAAQLFQKACDGGNATGCANLGAAYEKGEGVKQDRARAVALYQKGCDGGSGRSCGNLGYLYSQGLGVTRDKARAALLYQKACDGGSAVGCTNLGYLYEKGEGVKQDKARAALLYQQACDGGHTLGCHALAGMYERGDGPAKDRSAAIRFYQKACSVGYDQSCKALRRLKASP